MKLTFFQKIGLVKVDEQERIDEFRKFDGIYSKSEDEIKELFKTF